MIVECPHCKSLLRTDSRSLEGVESVQCGACLNTFDALEHIKLDAAVDPVTLEDASVVRQRTVFDGLPPSGRSEHGAQVRQRRSTVAEHGPAESFWRRFAWPLIAVLVAAVIAVGHVSRDRLATTPLGHTMVNAWCGAVGCEISAIRDFSAIRLIRRQIYAHPSRDNALVVSLAMVNDAHFAQDFPVLLVRMTNRAGAAVAQGEFEPADYLDDFDTSVLMQPGRAVDVQLEVEDPGSDAVSFDLEFR